MTHTVKMKMEIVDQHTIKDRLYCLPLNKGQIINEAIPEMIDAKIIERSQSLWSFTLVLVKANDRSYASVDLRSLNKIVKPVSF